VEIIVKSVVNFVFFPIVIIGLSSIVSFYYGIKHLIKNRSIEVFERKIVLETALISFGTILLLIILRWKLPELLTTNIHQAIFPSHQYTVAIIGNSTFDIHSLFFYFAVTGFIYKFKEVQYGVIPKKYFIRRNLLPMFAISMFCTFAPLLFEQVIKG